MSDDGVSWGGVSRGLYLVGFGTFLFLNTQDILPWAFWREALVYWPVGLVALGIRLVFERTRMPWLILAGPLLVLGTLTYVSVRRAPSWDHAWSSIVAVRPENTRRWTLEGRMAMLSLDLKARDLPEGHLVSGRGSPDGRSGTRITHSGDRARVRVGGSSRGWSVIGFPRPPRRLELALARDLPVAVDLDIAFAEGTIDLAAAPVSRFDIDGAFNDLELTLGAPASDVRLSLDGAFSRLTLRVPPETPVSTYSDGFLNFVDGRPGAGDLRGPGYRLYVDGAFNSLTIRSH